jgi:hypothetical protein
MHSLTSRLRSSGGMYSGHQSLGDGKVVMQDLGHRGKTIRCARRIGQHLDVGGVVIVVNTYIQHSATPSRLLTSTAKCTMQ